MKQKIMAEIREWGEAALIAVAIALFIITFFIQQFKIPSGSMIPTLQIGDRLFVDKFLYSARIPFINIKLPLPMIRQLKRGEIIVFISPEDPKKDFIKRLIAMGGETIEIREGRVYIDGELIKEPSSIRSVYYYNGGDYGKEGEAVKVPKGSYFVLGDNSGNSRDSRYWGFVPKKNIIGRAIFLCWPLYRMKVMK